MGPYREQIGNLEQNNTQERFGLLRMIWFCSQTNKGHPQSSNYILGGRRWKFELGIQCSDWDKLGETVPISRRMKVNPMEISEDIAPNRSDST